jgi:phosphoribosylaminoimidazolecarboxamide formyltransferase/IMP cyclohydrolase
VAVNIVGKVDNWVTVRRALVSVSDKTGLELLAPGLLEINPDLHFYSTGGTYTALQKILGAKAVGKTLDFKIYLGLLTETYNEHHQADLARTAALPIDLVVVNLYPFAQTIAREGVTVEEARANIDIGGPCMVRAAAKNYLRVASVVDPHDYPALLDTLRHSGGRLSLARRFELATKAFGHTAQYDAAISAYLARQNSAAVPSAYTLMNR